MLLRSSELTQQDPAGTTLAVLTCCWQDEEVVLVVVELEHVAPWDPASLNLRRKCKLEATTAERVAVAVPSSCNLGEVGRHYACKTKIACFARSSWHWPPPWDCNEPDAKTVHAVQYW